MMRVYPIARLLLIALLATLALLSVTRAESRDTGRERVTRDAIATIAVADLPAEGRATLALIHAGGPFPYPKDGITFGNRERRLPSHPRGYYQEYTVKTPGVRNRGARRIIAGGQAEFYYSDDHYETFRRILE